MRRHVTFDNQSGQRLSAALELPVAEPGAAAIFAHCFTCSKNVSSASRISRALAERGIAVLRFDFTGLGNSDGDFSNTNFSSNVADLLSAHAFLSDTLQTPTLLIGHSLGGAAVLAAASQLPSVKAIATLGAPATAAHIRHLLSDIADDVLNDGCAEMELGGRRFPIKRQLLEDLDNYTSTRHIAALQKSLLVLHSPVDEIVDIDEAAKIYRAARHPKSFISLDTADHLLSDPADADYAAAVIATWASRYVETATPARMARALHDGEVWVEELNRAFTRRIVTGSHALLADEPAAIGGDNRGMNPYDLLLAALGACTSMTMRMYANRKQLPLEHIEVLLRHSRIHAHDCEQCEAPDGMVDRIEKFIGFDGALSDAQRTRLLEIADRCPVHKTLDNEILITTQQMSRAHE